ncbi:MAG: polysaccharide biosynthesis tyrosine autokinase [Sphingomonas sp.]
MPEHNLGAHGDPLPFQGQEAEVDPIFSIDIPRLISTLRRNAYLIVGIIFVMLVLGVIATTLMTPKYTATGSVQINQEAARVLKTEDDMEPASSSQDVERFLQTQVDVLRSRATEYRVARELKLLDNPRFFAAMGVPVDLANFTPEERREAALKLIRGNLGVTLPRMSRVVTINFTSPDPKLAAQVVNAFSRAFIQSNLQRKYDSSSYAREFISRQLAEAKERLEGSERALNSYAREAGLIRTQSGATSSEGGTSSGPSTSVTTASLVQLNQVANDARATRIAAEQRWNSARVAPLLSIPAVLSNQAVQEMLQERAKQSASLRQERARHLESHPSVQQLSAQVSELDRQINDLASGIRNGIRDEYRVALQQERSLDSQVSGLKDATLAEQDRGVRFGILAREADTNRTMYEGLLQRFKEVSASAGLSSNNISIIDEAEPPVVPSSPKLWVNMFLSLVAGCGLAVAVVFIRERIDDSIRVPEDAERKLELPVIGVIPIAREGADLLEELLSPRTNVAEAYHALRTSLIYSSPEGLPRSLLVTSSQPSEGKSTTSFAVAHDIARLGKRVILVDTDLRRPSLHRIIGIDNSVGVVDLITHHASSVSPIRPSGYENLAFISSGPVPPNPTELLSSNRMRELLNQLHQEYDIVVLDGPPVLGLADAPILSALAEATLFVVEAGRSRRGGAKAAIRRLRSAHGRLVGSVLTKFDSKRAGTQYYGNEYYYYGSEAPGEAPTKERRGARS